MWNNGLTYDERRSHFIELVSEYEQSPISLIDCVTVNSPSDCEKELSLYIELGYEGAMLRDPNSLYKQGRHTLKSQALLKLKKFYDDEAVAIGFEEKLHNENVQEKDERGYVKRSQKKEGMVPANTLGALVVKWKDVEFKIGSGYTDIQRQEIWDNREDLLGKQITYKYQELSKYGVPRFPVWKCFREEFNV